MIKLCGVDLEAGLSLSKLLKIHILDRVLLLAFLHRRMAPTLTNLVKDLSLIMLVSSWKGCQGSSLLMKSSLGI